MKKYTLLFSAILTTLITLMGHTQTVTLSFDKPLLEQRGAYVEIVYPHLMNGGKPGSPLLPLYNHNLLLPAGLEVSAVTITDIQYYPTRAHGVIVPAQKPVPLSLRQDTIPFTPPDSNIYKKRQFPPKAITHHQTHFLAGHGIASFQVCPVVYAPNTHEIRFISSISFAYKTTNSRKERCRTSTTEEVKTRIRKIVSNPEQLHSYPQHNDESTSDILIISKAAYLPLMKDFIAYKNSVGFFVTTRSTEEIFNTYEGEDAQEQIRNCIKAIYEEEGISYVLLVGDTDPANETQRIIPHRGMKALDDYDIPSDLYYSNLDGNWDENDNGIWGEVGEGDLYAEVAIGRFCVDSPGEIAHMIHKSIHYQDAPVVSDAHKFLLVGENLNNDPLTWGGTYMDELHYGTSNHDFTTMGISETVHVSHLYDRDEVWNPKQIRDHFNLYGLNFLNHMGHSNVNYNMKMNNQDVTTQRFKNDGISRGFSIGYSQGCYNGSFDNRGTNLGYSTGDCFAEKITTLETGYAAAIANARYGWYMPGNTDASSQFYNRCFIQALFGEEITHIGWANTYSKERETSWLEDEYFRWTAYELNLFGDPSLDIYTAKPEPIHLTLPNTIIEGTNQLEFNSDAPHARVALLQDSVLLLRTFTDAEGKCNLTLPSPAIGGQNYTVSMIGHNKLRHIQTIEVVQNSAVIICTEAIICDTAYNGNGNGNADYGESVNVKLTFENRGNKPCNDALFTALTTDTAITIHHNHTHTGSLEPGESVVLSNALTLDLAPDILPGNRTIQIMLDEDKTWKNAFLLKVGGAIPSIEETLLTEVSGNQNGRVDPGETALLTYILKNRGNTSLEEVTFTLTLHDIYLSCSNPVQALGDIEAGEQIEVSFEITADEKTPEGFSAFVSFEMNGIREKHFLKNHSLSVGIPQILICDLDGNKNSGPELLATIERCGGNAEYRTHIPEDLSGYNAIFLCLGIFPHAHDVTQEEGQLFADFLLSGKSMYLESGNFWYFNDSTALHQMMQITSSIGNGWIYGNEQLIGLEGTFGEGMEFAYTGDNDHIDHLEVSEPTTLIFNSEPHTFGAMAAHQGENYTMIASSFEWSGLTPTNESSTTQQLMEEIMNYLHINTAKPPIISLGKDTTICLYHQILLDAGEGFEEYLWSNGATTQTITVDTSSFKEIVNPITVQVTDTYGYIGSDEIVITFSNCADITEKSKETLKVTIYPNPTKDQLTIMYPQETFSLSISDLFGRVIHTENRCYHSSTINLGNQKKGIYLLSISTKKGVIQQKIELL
ncbi:MAG: hypothetical protein CSA95_09065 [Bacteroidetes bacterium]|nr:MAG: hypothetical protein CSA95_09065 [Bacteroidota bacterium]PIE87890.1 MAG: hypothetical protein CSA04_04695 [Bacteroidota bacterium]